MRLYGFLSTGIELEQRGHFHLEHGKGTFGKISKRYAILATIGSVVGNLVRTVCHISDEASGCQGCTVGSEIMI